MAARLAALVGADGRLRAGHGDLAIAGLTADSREVRSGYLFAALAGSRTDGARFIADALSRGAVAVLAGETAAIAVPANVVMVRAAEPRHLLALMAARFFGRQPETVVAVTGTNGKTSVVSFVRQIWRQLGHEAASMGTVGVVTAKGERKVDHTTPDPVRLQALMAELADEGITHLALEASSHGLEQMRLDGLVLAAGAFTNLSRDHLDYHPSGQAYFAAKARLFEVLLAPGAAAVLNADSQDAMRLEAPSRARGLQVISVGHKGHDLTIVEQARRGLGQHLVIAGRTGHHAVHLPLVGDFQASNALVAAGLVIATGGEEVRVVRALEGLKGARGRLELVATTPAGASIFVDYAHTPDALRTALEALRPYTAGRLVVVFGAGGDRDRGKRPPMGAITAQLADLAIVTDDNPRSEDPAAIRAEIMAACPGGIEVGDRGAAIGQAIAGLKAGDVLLVAGKGHESGQIVGDRIVPFSDHAVVRGWVEGEPHV
jgi:UDP-N-acetylmuramoyl-L-alanyl-D-glutamate--2,6-diaminopimelate ligase